MFKPKILTIWSDYSKEQFLKDMMSAAIVTVISIPLSIAFSVSQGVSPEIGLYVSIIASFILAVFGGSHVQIGGPGAVYIVVAASIIANYGIDALIISTIIAGVLLILLGVFRLGSLIKFLPYPIMIGFMSAIAVTVFTSQFRNFLGLQVTGVPSNFIARWGFYLSNLHRLDPLTFAVGLLGLAILIFWPKVTKKVPGPLIALLVTTTIVQVFNLPIATIGSQFNDITLRLPQIQIPDLSVNNLLAYADHAFTIAFLCVVGSLMTAVAADNLIGKKHDSNTELIAQGISNIIVGFFGFIPSAGVPTRTMANVESGGRTPMAALMHSIMLLCALVFLLPLMRLIPMVTLAAMLIMAAYGMSEWRTFKRLLSAPRGDALVLIVTFVLTVTVELSVAVITGMLLSSLIFIRRMSNAMHIEDSSESKDLPEEIRVYDVHGPLFFGDTDRFLDAISVNEDKVKVVILRLRDVGSMDSTALRTINILHEKCRLNDKSLVLSETTDGPYHAMKKIGMIQQLKKENICRDFEDAVKIALKKIEQLPA